jgi:hypothetical protein
MEMKRLVEHEGLNEDEAEEYELDTNPAYAIILVEQE